MKKTCTLLALAFVTSVAAFACTAPYVGAEPSNDATSSVTSNAINASGGTGNLAYLGSQDFLYQCAGSAHVLGCGDQVRSIPDTQPYFAAPWATSACHQWFTFRKGNRCVEAQRLERSDSHQLIEGNPALFDGLGLAHSDGANCRGGSGSATEVSVVPGRHCGDSAGVTSTDPDGGTTEPGTGKGAGTDDGSGKNSDPGTGTDTDPGKGGDDDGSGKGSGDDGSGKK